MTAASPEYKSRYTYLLKMARQSLAIKKKAGWSRDIGAGWTKEDIVDLRPIAKGGGGICPTCGQRIPEEATASFTLVDHVGEYTMTMKDLNLRETEEVVKWLIDAEAKRTAEEAKGEI